MFEPEKLIGKIVGLKSFGATEFKMYKITEIIMQFFSEKTNPHQNWAAYKTIDGNSFPIYQQVIDSLLNNGFYTIKPFDESNETIEYKLF